MPQSKQLFEIAWILGALSARQHFDH
jgi:hypothetical protein